MDRRVIRNGSYGAIGMFIITSFYYIFADLYILGMGFSFWNIVIALLGAAIMAIIFFIPVVVISLIFYYLKGDLDKEKKKE